MTSFYLPAGVGHAEREDRLRAALVGIPFLTPLDLIALLGGEVDNATPEEVGMAEWDLRTHGYRLERVALWGCRRVFPRYVRDEVWPEDAAWFDRVGGGLPAAG